MSRSENSPSDSSAFDALVAATVRPLTGNAEQRLSAIAVLSENANPDHPAAAETIARWDKVDAKKRPFPWSATLYVIAFGALITAVLWQRDEIRFAAEFHDVSFFDPPDAILPEGLNLQQKLLLGDPKLGGLENAEDLYFSDPENPAYFAEYAIHYSNHFSKMPPGFLETAARIDPENSFFLYLAAGRMDYDAIKLEQRTGPAPKPRIVNGVRLSPPPHERDYKINDPATYARSLKLIEKASQLPVFRTYGNTMIEARMRCFPEAQSIMQRTHAALFFYSQTSGVISIRKVSDTLSARAQELSRAGDKEGFLKLVDMRHKLISRLVGNRDSNLINELVNMVVAAGTSEYFHYAADRLGMVELAGKFGEENRLFREMADRRRIRSSDEFEWVTERAALLSGLTLPMIMRQSETPPPITLADLSPQRYADHAFGMRLGLTAVALSLLIFALPVFLFRYVFPASLRKPPPA
ncbi:MAG: hypothetical protein ABJQ29_12285 [Luteolibacter sp.]